VLAVLAAYERRHTMYFRFYSLLHQIDQGVQMNKNCKQLTDERDYLSDQITTMEAQLAVEVAKFNRIHESHISNLMKELKDFTGDDQCSIDERG